MSLDVSISGWLEELRHAESYVEPYLKGFAEDKAAFTGKGYREGSGRMQPENHALELIELMRGQCLMGDPQVRFTTDLPGPAQIRATARTLATNVWTRQTRMRNLNEELLTDWLFRYAVCHVTSEPAPGCETMDDPPYWPSARRVSPRHFRFDPAAKTRRERRWEAHLNIYSRKELRRLAQDPESGWDAEALDKLERMRVAQFREAGVTIPERDEVAVWLIWAPHEQQEGKSRDDGYNGTLYAIADGQAAGVGWVRKPMPYYGPPQGPYVVGGDLLVPDESIPMGAIPATKGQAEWLNRAKRATMRAHEAYKQMVFVRGGAALEEKIKNGRDQFVYAHDDPNLRDNVVPVVVGGATEQHFAAEEGAHQTLDRASGITDLQRGTVDPRNKATQDALAAEAANNRVGFRVAKFRGLVAEILFRVAYFIDRDEDVEIEVGEEALAAGLPGTTIRGGLSDDQPSEEFERTTIEIHVGSMERDLAGDAQHRSLVIDETLQLAAALGPMTALFWDWQTYVDVKAQLSGVRELRNMINVPAMQQIGALMLMQQAEAGGQPTRGSSGPEPSYSRKIQGSSKPAGGTPGASLAPAMAKKAGGSRGATPKPGGAKPARAAY